MAKKGQQKALNLRSTQKDLSSDSSSQSGSESSSGSSSDDDDSNRQEAKRKDQKRQTKQTRTLTVRKPTTMLKRQGTLNKIGKSGFSQEEMQEDQDDFNIGRQDRGRKQTVINKVTESTTDVKRGQQKGMTRVEAQNKIQNLESELINEKQRQEQLYKQKEEQDIQARKEMNSLHQDKLNLLRKADQKKSHIQSIQKKLEEQKKNSIDIIKQKSEIKTGCGICRPNFFSNLVKYFFDSYLLSSFSYQMSNYFDYKVYEHFAFLSFFYNNCFVAIIFLIYLMINQVVNNSSKFSGLSLFFSYTFEANSSYLLLCLAFMLSQIIIVFVKYDKYKRKRVREVARFSSRINLFRLCISDYNWKISKRVQLEKIQLAFVDRAQYILNSQNTGSRSSQKSKFDMTKFAFRTLGLTLTLGVAIGQVVCIKFILEKLKFSDSSFYIERIIQGAICSSICIAGSSFIEFLNSLEQYSGQSIKAIKCYATQIIPCCYILFARTLLLFRNKYKIPSYITIDSFVETSFKCPNEQLAYDLIILMICYAAVTILSTYFIIFWHIIVMKCKSDSSNISTSIGKKYYYYIRFRSDYQTIPYLIVYFLMCCIIPLNPFIVLINLLVFALIFFHNFLQTRRFFLPQLDSLSQTMVKGIIIKLLAISIIAGTIYQIVLFSLDYDLGYFLQKDQILQCGPYRLSNSGLNEIWESFGSFTDVLAVITWKPIILFFLIFFILITVSSRNQIKEWQKQYQEKDNELRAIKRFYSQQVDHLEDKVNYAQENIVNMVEEDIIEINTKQDKFNKNKQLSNTNLMSGNDGAYLMSQNHSIVNLPQANGSMFSNVAFTNRDNDITLQNLNGGNGGTNNLNSRFPSISFNIPPRQGYNMPQAGINTPHANGTPMNTIGTPLNGSKQYINDSPLKGSYQTLSSAHQLNGGNNNGTKSIFVNNLKKY